jgi:hypothetical protein
MLDNMLDPMRLQPPDHVDDALDEFAGEPLEPDVGWPQILELVLEDLRALTVSGAWPAEGGGDTDDTNDTDQVESLTFLRQHLLGIAATIQERIELLRQRLPSPPTTKSGQ